MCRVTVDDSGLCCVHVTSFPPLIISFCFFPALNNPLCLFINYSVHSAQQLNESLSSSFSSVISCSLTDLSSKHPRSWNTLILVKQRQFQQTVANFPVLLRICLPTAPPLYIAWTTVKPSGCRWKTWILAKGTNLIPGLISGNGTICPGQVFRLKAIEIAAARASPTVCLELNWSAAGGKANSRARRISLSQAPALELAK